MILPKACGWFWTFTFEILTLIFVRIHKGTKSVANFEKYMQAEAAKTPKNGKILHHDLLLKICYVKSRQVQGVLLLVVRSAWVLPKVFRIFYEYFWRTTLKDYYGVPYIRQKSNMASVAPKVARQLSFAQKVKAAFHNWYIYACGYRQLGKSIWLSRTLFCDR